MLSHTKGFVLGVPIPVLDALLMTQPPVNVPGETQDGGPSTWTPALLTGTQMQFCAPGFGLAHAGPLQPSGE